MILPFATRAAVGVTLGKQAGIQLPVCVPQTMGTDRAGISLKSRGPQWIRTLASQSRIRSIRTCQRNRDETGDKQSRSLESRTEVAVHEQFPGS